MFSYACDARLRVAFLSRMSWWTKDDWHGRPQSLDERPCHSGSWSCAHSKNVNPIIQDHAQSDREAPVEYRKAHEVSPRRAREREPKPKGNHGADLARQPCNGPEDGYHQWWLRNHHSVAPRPCWYTEKFILDYQKQEYRSPREFTFNSAMATLGDISFRTEYSGLELAHRVNILFWTCSSRFLPVCILRCLPWWWYKKRKGCRAGGESTLDAPTKAMVWQVVRISRRLSSLFWKGMLQKATVRGRFQSISDRESIHRVENNRWMNEWML